MEGQQKNMVVLLARWTFKNYNMVEKITQPDEVQFSTTESDLHT